MKNKKEKKHVEKQYLRISDLIKRYNFSRGHINNMINNGALPPPMIFGDIKIWPTKIIDDLDKQRNEEYIEYLRDNGFNINIKL